MAKILRGEIRWANLNPTIGREQSGERPVLILSHNVFNERSGTVIAMEPIAKLRGRGIFPPQGEKKRGEERVSPAKGW